MTNNISESEEWLKREDSACRSDRSARLQWLASKTPNTEYWTFPGGLLSKYLFEEARYCFIYGQYLATIVLGLSYLEHTLASLFYASGRDDLERASFFKLLNEALNYGWINKLEFDNLQNAREIRNSITHFHGPGDDNTIEYRAVTDNEFLYTIIEVDARHVMETVVHFIDKNAV